MSQDEINSTKIFLNPIPWDLNRQNVNLAHALSLP